LREPRNASARTVGVLININISGFPELLYKRQMKLTNKEIYATVKKPTVTQTVRLHRLCWFGDVQRMEENRIPKIVLYMNFESTRLRGRPRNRWQEVVREGGRIDDGEEW
jgi:hypothetical protein